MTLAGIASRVHTAAGWLTPRRIRVHAICLALCAWTVVAVDFSTPGLTDRGGNIKFQDFLQFYIAGRQIDRGDIAHLYDPATAAADLQSLLGHATTVRLPPVYGPQVGLFFLPLSRLSFFEAAIAWTGVSVILYLFCCYIVWRACPGLRARPGLLALAVCAYPPFFHFVIRGQLSALILACFVAAFYALRSGRQFLAGFLLGFLVFKPQFLLGILALFFLARAGKSFAGAVFAVLLQLGFTWMYFGRAVMSAYARTLWHLPQVTAIEEPGPSLAQMHSLRSFWLLLVGQPVVALGLYVISSALILGLAVASWRRRGPLALRFSALVVAAVLVNPHLFVYDLLVLAPAVLLLADWAIQNAADSRVAALRVLLYLACLLPLLGPVTKWTHLQLSVPVFVLLQWMLWDIMRRDAPAIAQVSATIA